MTYRISVSNICKTESYTKYFDDELRNDSDVVKLLGNGIFYIPFNKENNDYDRNGVSTAKVSFHQKINDDKELLSENNTEKWNLLITSYKPYYSKLEQLTIDVICEKSLYEKIERFAENNNQIEISFNVIKWKNFDESEVENTFDIAKCKIEDFQISSIPNSNKLSFIDYEIIDIENYLIRKNCVNSSGQIADICKEFAQSFRKVPAHIDKSRLIGEIESLIYNYRSTFHDYKNEKDKLHLASLLEKYGFELTAYSKSDELDFEKITEKKDRYEAIRIFNSLWNKKNVEDIFKNGYIFNSSDAVYIADEYIGLKYVYSITCERIIFDVLISCYIEEYSNSAQYSNNISSDALASITYGSYKPKLESKNSFVEFIVTSISHVFGRIISGLISWWISGLIAGNNETAHIILFGTMFAADTVLMGIYQNHKIKSEKNTASTIEEHYFNIIKNMCNLHYYSHYMDVKLMRHMLNKLSASNVKFQHQVFQLISLVESRK
jgi:hypothetical protein